MNKESKYITCECGCDVIYVSVTAKNPKSGTCAGCRKEVIIPRGSTLQVTR